MEKNREKREKIEKPDMSQGVLLLERYDENGAMLKGSFRRSGFQGPVVVIEDSGFLPPDVLSVFRWFCRDSEDTPLPGVPADTPFARAEDGRADGSGASGGRHDGSQEKKENAEKEYSITHAGWKMGKPRYFNQIELPDYWEISANGTSGEIHNMEHLRGRIFFSLPTTHRLVSEVDWLDERGTVRCTDHYDNRGLLYGRTTFNRLGQRYNRSWFDEKGRERVVENAVTGDITVNRNGKVWFFRSRRDLAVAMLREIGADGQRIYYNTLSVPMFVSDRLVESDRGNVLFWQEQPRDDIPGNMQLILDGSTHTQEIKVQNRQSWKDLIAAGADPNVVKPLGYVYDFARENAGGTEALICTNSDNIEQLQQVVEGLPGIQFHIAAITEMSSKLLSFGKYDNVRLYPNVRESMVEELFGKCDYYFDINHANEILDAVKQAFLHDQLIMGFPQTLHNPRYISDEQICPDAEALCAQVRSFSADASLLHAAVLLQRRTAMAEEKDAYRAIFSE